MFECYLLDAIDLVLGRDLPDEVFADAVIDQARLKAGISPEETWGLCSD